MASRILLQPGQIWTPQDSSGSKGEARLILDLPRQMISYRPLGPSAASNSVRASTTDALLVAQSKFRRWIKQEQAVLTGRAEDVKASPASELAKKISTLRKSLDMSQQVLADALGISRSLIAAMETGRTSSATKHMPRLAEIFQVPIELFVDGLTEHRKTMELSPDESDLIDLYRRLRPELKISTQKYIERQSRK